MSIEYQIHNFILENFLFTNDPSELAVDDSFLAKGIVDSTGMMEVIYFLEDKYGFKIEDAEMVPENLDSVRNIVNFIERKSKA